MNMTVARLAEAIELRDIALRIGCDRTGHVYVIAFKSGSWRDILRLGR
jgi:hypothetical protein